MKIVQNRFSSIYSNDRFNLNSDIYSDGIYKNGIKEFVHSSPIVHDKSSFGKVPVEKQNSLDNSVSSSVLDSSTVFTNTDKIKIFENENEAFLWYKKFYYKNLLEDDELKEEDLCKNYFIVDGNNIGKYYKYFNGMIKSLSVDINVDVNFKRSDTNNECDEEESSSSSSSSSSSEDDGSGSGSTLSIDDLKDVISEFPFVKTLQSETDEGFVNANFQMNINTEKIFEDPNFQQRLPARSEIFRNIENMTTYEDDDEEIDTLRILNPAFGIANLYEENWKFSEEEFKNIFSKNEKFPENSVLVNDPIILNSLSSFPLTSNSPSCSLNVNFERNSINLPRCSDGGSNNNNYYFDNSNFGFYSVNVSKSCNEAVSRVGLGFNFVLRDILYVKSENKYLCFVEIEVDMSYNINRRAPFNTDFNLFTTNENSKVAKAGSALQSSSGSSEEDEEFNYTKKKFNIYLDNSENPLEIEVHELPSEYSIDSDGEDNCYTGNRSLTISRNNFNFRVNTWKDEDFGPTIFPPKIGE